MPRTIISLDQDLKQWLDKEAQHRGKTMTSVVREALREYRNRLSLKRPGLHEVLDRTRGTWTEGDGLAWQQSMRDEWSKD